jgi:hypothetical protein
MWELIGSILKVLAIVVGGIFAVIGLLHDYRDKKGKITDWGRIALWGIGVSTVIGVLTQTIESHQDKKHSDEQRERTERLLSEIGRAVYPLQSIAVTQLEIVYPANRAPFANFFSKPFEYDSAAKLYKGKKVFRLPGSDDENDFPAMWTLTRPRLQVAVWKRRTSDESKPDLSFAVSPITFENPKKGDELRVITNTPSPAAQLSLSPGMASLQDLEGSKIRVSINIREGYRDARFKDVQDTLKDTKIEKFAFSAGNHEITTELHPGKDPGAFIGTFPDRITSSSTE